MGNCLRSNNKVLAEDIAVKQRQGSTKSHVRDAKRNRNGVRLRLQEDQGTGNIGGGSFGGNNNHNGETNSGVVRVKLVVTQEELKQILSYKNGGSKLSSVEQLLSEMKFRGRSVLEAGTSDGTMNGSWSPALESIPEEH